MTESEAQKRMALNEATFREFNMKLQKAIDETNQIAKEENAAPIAIDSKMPLYFICECSVPTCTERISLSLDQYKKAHKKNNQFTIACGHEIETIEDVIKRTKNYCVVEKHRQPPIKGTKLVPISD